MASSRKKKRKRNSSEAPLIRPKRKKEILGLILMALALLVSLALLTYHPIDNTIARSFSLEAALHPAETQAENALGLVGATLAWLLVPHFLGYPVLLFTGLLFVWGYIVFRHRPVVYLPLLSVLTVIGAFLIACIIGWFGHTLNADVSRWAGAVGIGVSGWMQRVFGTPGSLILLGVSAVIALLLAIDHDIQRSLDRLAELTAAARERLRLWWKNVGAWWEERREEQARRREKRRARREEARKEREAKRQTKETTSETKSKEKPKKSKSESTSSADSSSAQSTTSESAPSSTPDAQEQDAGSYARRNDLFRAKDADEASSSETDSAPEPAPQSSSEKPSPPHPDPEPAGTETDDSDDVELEVQEQIEEEKAEDIDRTKTEAPAEDFEYEPPPIDLLDAPQDDDPAIDYDELEQNKQILLDKLETYNIDIQNIKAVVGPTVTRYEMIPAPGIKVSRIKSLEDDLAMAMAAQGVRMIAPIPGKSAVGVEIANRNRELVRLRDVIGTAKFRDTEMELPVPLGKTIEGEVFLADLTKMPHLLIAGATGSGKSVGLNALITGLIYACHPANLKFVIIDPKKIELQQYTHLRSHFMAQPEDLDEAVITDVDEALGVLKSCEKEMEERYDLLSEASVRGIQQYNRKFKNGDLPAADGHRHMPYIVVVVDEMADLMMQTDKDVEGPIARLAQKARAVGIHLVLATQRPSVDVITGLIKANFPSRIAYEVASRVDSRTILDQIGAEGLVGNGDLLYLSGSKLKRIQGPFVSVDEVERVVDFIADQAEVGTYTLPSLTDAGHGPDSTLGVEDTDDKFEEGARVIVRRQQGSVSLLQRKLAVGYTRAARIVDQLEEAGIVGPFNGTKARDVLVDSEDELERVLAGEGLDEEEAEVDD